jgi:hypothetical protein
MIINCEGFKRLLTQSASENGSGPAGRNVKS